MAVLDVLARFTHRATWAKVSEGKTIHYGSRIIETSYRARAHASRLVWFGLAEHGDKRSGNYRVTENGLLFLQGRISVPVLIYCKDGEVIEMSKDRVFLRDIKGVVLDKAYWDSYALFQKHEEPPNQSKFGF